MVSCGEGILPSNRGQDARDTQGRDALATKKTIGKLALAAATRRGAVCSDAVETQDFASLQMPLRAHHEHEERA